MRSPVIVFHSAAKFAQTFINTEDLQPVGQQLLDKAAKLLPELATSSDWLQVDRWRYAFATIPLANNCLNAYAPQPIVCCGDWCGSDRLESAMRSGIAAAEQINQALQLCPTLPENAFLKT